MKYHQGLIIRLVLLFLPAALLSFILTPLTVYAVKYLLFAYAPVVTDRSLVINNIGFNFVEACIATYAYLFLWYLCLLTKGIKLITRTKIIVYGFLLIFLMNIFRIVLLIILGVDYGFYWFNVVHLFFWKFLSGVYVALVWIFLVKIYNIKGIPVYDDLKTLYKDSLFRKHRR